jgi:peptide-methionine (R)-S-oxide reductase
MQDNNKITEKIFKSDEEWKKILTPEQYRVLREKGTERPGTGLYDQHFVKGTYQCAACDLELFTSDSKYDAGCGWPSFSTPSDKKVVTEHLDKSFGMTRVEIVCSRCGGHLGHVFNDGPPPTGLRYCINSASLKFVPEQ